METETVTVHEEWSQNEMIRYIDHADGTRTVLEHIENPCFPFVRFHYPRDFAEEFSTYKAIRDSSPHIGE